MDSQGTRKNKMNILEWQLLTIRLAMLSIPFYLLLLSPTCGLFGPSIPKNYALWRVALPAVIPGLVFSVVGVLRESNPSVGISGLAIVGLMIANQFVEPYFAVFDFILLLFFLEVATTLTSFSKIAESTLPGKNENASYNYRLALGEYAKRQVAVIAFTLAVSLGAIFIVINFVPSFGITGIAFLTTIALLAVFATLATRYYGR